MMLRLLGAFPSLSAPSLSSPYLPSAGKQRLLNFSCTIAARANTVVNICLFACDLLHVTLET